ncbi:hypothetical protein N7490_012273 [Penicillium lividum]|nr:hypothetical protein N7490_012273 [Penicillium lividum]
MKKNQAARPQSGPLLLGESDDNEQSVNHTILIAITALGCLHTFTIPHSLEINGLAERLGGLIVKRACALLYEGKLPFELWPEAIYTAAYLLNRTLTKILDGWIVPWEEARRFIDDSPKPWTSIANLRLYGSLAYCRKQNPIPRLQKMTARSDIGYLVGYVASNIWRIWIPRRGVRVVRDAVFDEKLCYSAENED